MLGALPLNCVGFRARRPGRRTLLIEGNKAVPGRPKPFRLWLVAGQVRAEARSCASSDGRFLWNMTLTN